MTKLEYFCGLLSANVVGVAIIHLSYGGLTGLGVAIVFSVLLGIAWPLPRSPR